MSEPKNDGSWPGVYFNTRHGNTVDAIEYCAKLERTLESNGFAPCDMPACNCGGWHKRDGQILREIMQACRAITKVKISSDILVPDELCDHVDQLAALLGELDAIQ